MPAPCSVGTSLRGTRDSRRRPRDRGAPAPDHQTRRTEQDAGTRTCRQPFSAPARPRHTVPRPPPGVHQRRPGLPTYPHVATVCGIRSGGRDSFLSARSVPRKDRLAILGDGPRCRTRDSSPRTTGSPECRMTCAPATTELGFASGRPSRRSGNHPTRQRHVGAPPASLCSDYGDHSKRTSGAPSSLSPPVDPVATKPCRS